MDTHTNRPAPEPTTTPASVPPDIAVSLVTEALDWVWRNAGAGALEHVEHTLVGYEQRDSLLMLDFETSGGERHQVALQASSQAESAPTHECDNCLGHDPASCINVPSVSAPTSEDRDER